MGIRSLALGLFSMLAFAAFTPAQGQISLPGNSLTAGQSTTVTYSNPARAGEIVLMKVDNGEGDVRVIEVQLDGNGEGSEEWEVPSTWMAAIFATDDAHESRMIDSAIPIV